MPYIVVKGGENLKIFGSLLGKPLSRVPGEGVMLTDLSQEQMQALYETNHPYIDLQEDKPAARTAAPEKADK